MHHSILATVVVLHLTMMQVDCGDSGGGEGGVGAITIHTSLSSHIHYNNITHHRGNNDVSPKHGINILSTRIMLKYDLTNIFTFINF